MLFTELFHGPDANHRHDVELHDIIDRKESIERKLLGGEGAWPPEDCGGPLMWRGRGGKMKEREIRREFDK